MQKMFAKVCNKPLMVVLGIPIKVVDE